MTLSFFIQQLIDSSPFPDFPEEIDCGFLSSLFESQNGRCALSGIAMTHSEFNDPMAVAVGMKDCAFGLKKGNIFLICRWVYDAKAAMTVPAFRQVLEAVVIAERQRLLYSSTALATGEAKLLFASDGSLIEVVTGDSSVMGIFLLGVVEWLLDNFWLKPLRVEFDLGRIKVAIRETLAREIGEVHHSSFVSVYGGPHESRQEARDVVIIWCAGTAGEVLSMPLSDPNVFTTVVEKLTGIITKELKRAEALSKIRQW